MLNTTYTKRAGHFESARHVKHPIEILLLCYSEKLCFFNKIIDRCYGVFGM